MNCPNCGLPAGENDKFCIGCGARLAAPEPPAEVELPKPEEIPEAVEKAIPEVEEVNAEFTKAAEEVTEVLEAPSPVVQPEPVPVPAAAPVVEAPTPKPTVPVNAAPLNAAPVAVEYKDDAEPTQKPGKLSKPLSVWGYFWRIILFSLPILNIIPLFVMAFSKGINKNSKHFASAVLILMLIGLILAVCGLVYLLITTEPEAINQFFANLFGKQA